MVVWFEKLMIRFFMSLDTTLFNFIGTLYDLLIAISRTSILSQGDIASFATRIEVLLGIFMLFKVSFSLITYIVNPDEFSDKSKGFGKLTQNSVISLVMLVLVPYIFQMAFSLQAKILDDNVLAKLLLGEKMQDSGEATIIDTAGNRMAFYVMIPFFSPNYAVEGLSDCMNMIDSDGNFSEECRDALENAGLTDFDLENYTHGVQNQSLGLTFRARTALATTVEVEDEGDDADQHFVIAYHKPLSTVTAVVVCLLLISFCIDIGVRSVKLAFLQLIYPIPVISYMDPKSGKDGMFTKWYKMCLSTFLSLFIRLLALYFGVYIITKVADFGMYDIINGSQITNSWVKIFIIIGVLMFIKQLPKILENMGIKIEGDGKFNLNPLKKIEEGAIGGDRLKKMHENWRKDGYGVGLGAKKLISGIDSRRAGKGFMNGVRKIQGNGAFSRASKWYHDLTPERTEQLKKSREAKADLNHKARMYEKGKANLERTSQLDPNFSVKGNIKNKKQKFKDLFLNNGQARENMSNPNLQRMMEKRYQELGKALVEQYGGDTAKNREYAQVAVEKEKAETELRRLQALQRRAYDPNSGRFKLKGATDITGKNNLDSAEALESAIEAQQKILKSVGEYAEREKEFQFKNGIVDDEIGVSKGMRPRRNDFNRE